jgi:hypothetical protein
MTLARNLVAAYWFTASTSFANRAAVLARALSNALAGIKPENRLDFIVVQVFLGQKLPHLSCLGFTPPSAPNSNP